MLTSSDQREALRHATPITATRDVVELARIKQRCEDDHIFFTRYFFKQRNAIKFRVNWHHHVIARALQRVIDGKCKNLVINVPPGSSKTEMAIINFIARSLALNPNCRFLHISSGEDLVLLNSQTAREIVQSDEFQQLWPMLIADDAKAKKRWNVMRELEGGTMLRGGGVYAVALGGQITGFRAGHMTEGFQGCFVAGTSILTKSGSIVIDEIKSGDMVLSYNHATQKIEERKVVATKKSIRLEIVETTTKSGIVTRSTPCHRYFDGKSYKPISEFHSGEFAWSISRNALDGVQSLQEDIRETKIRDKKIYRARTKKYFLFSQLLENIPFWRYFEKIANVSMPRVQFRVQAIKPHDQDLFSSMRKQTAFNENAWEWKFKFQSAIQGLSNIISINEATHKRARRLEMFGLQFKQKNGNSSFERKEIRQQARESGDVMQEVSYCSPQIYADAISSIRSISGGQTEVYDIQVEGNHNFFANGILVHNCILVDDPLKADNAFSEAAVKAANRQLLTTVKSRKANPDTPIIVIMQRVGEKDPTGFIKGGNLPGVWEYVTIPALIDDAYVLTLDEDLREMVDSSERDEKGRFSYWPYKEPLKDLLALEAGSGTDREGNRVSRFVFNSQYQQAPKAIGGNIIHGKDFKLVGMAPKILYRKLFADTAMKTKEANDYSVFECWGKGEDGKSYLLDLLRGKWEAPDLKRNARAFWNKHRDTAAYPTAQWGICREMQVEDKASGTGLIQDIKRGEVIDGVRYDPIPVKAIERNTDKLTRVMDVVPYIEAGLVCLLADAPYVSDFVSECEAFTADDSHAYDDQIDPMCDALVDMQSQKPRGFFDIAR